VAIEVPIAAVVFGRPVGLTSAAAFLNSLRTKSTTWLPQPHARVAPAPPCR